MSKRKGLRGSQWASSTILREGGLKAATIKWICNAVAVVIVVVVVEVDGDGDGDGDVAGSSRAGVSESAATRGGCSAFRGSTSTGVPLSSLQ